MNNPSSTVFVLYFVYQEYSECDDGGDDEIRKVSGIFSDEEKVKKIVEELNQKLIDEYDEEYATEFESEDHYEYKSMVLDTYTS
jgi:hypothetical protein